MSRYQSLAEVVQDAVFKSSFTAQELAKSINKPYPTLMRELNPYDLSAKLGAETLLAMMEQMKDITPLEYMAARLGYKVVPA